MSVWKMYPPDKHLLDSVEGPAALNVACVDMYAKPPVNRPVKIIVELNNGVVLYIFYANPLGTPVIRAPLGDIHAGLYIDDGFRADLFVEIHEEMQLQGQLTFKSLREEADEPVIVESK